MTAPLNSRPEASSDLEPDEFELFDLTVTVEGAVSSAAITSVKDSKSKVKIWSFPRAAVFHSMPWPRCCR